MQRTTKIALISGSILAVSGIVYLMYKKSSTSSTTGSNLGDNLQRIYNQLLRTSGIPKQTEAEKAQALKAQEQVKSQLQPQPQKPQPQFQPDTQKKEQPKPQQPQQPQQSQDQKIIAYNDAQYQLGGYSTGDSGVGGYSGGYSSGYGASFGVASSGSAYGTSSGYGSNAWWLKDRGYGGMISDYAT